MLWTAGDLGTTAADLEAVSRSCAFVRTDEEYLATRIPEESDHYERLVALTEEITRRAFSDEVVAPGTTTVGDVRRFMYDALWDAGPWESVSPCSYIT